MLRVIIMIFLCFALNACNLGTNSRNSLNPYIDAPPISLQLHSVREALSDDFEGTLAAVAEMGFDGVEFAAGRFGGYENNPDALKAILEDLGLRTSGVHVSFSQLKQNAEKHLTFFKALGTNLVVIPHDARIDNPVKINEFIAELKPLIKEAEKKGLTLGYHNHAKEFKSFGNTTFWDYLAQNTPQTFALQLDVGWANFAEVNPADFVKRYPGRTLTTHYKIRTYKGKPGPVSKDAKVILGEDDYDWATLIETNISQGGTQWIVVEQEEYPEGLTPLETVNQSKKGLDRILRARGIRLLSS